MNIVVLNGNPDELRHSFDRYLADLGQALRSQGHTVDELRLRDLDLRDCVGCFGCWVKTPGQCVVNDAAHVIDAAVIRSDFTLWAAPLRMGFPSALLKRALDKSIPLVHPYFEVVNNEAHHRSRYARYPRLGLLVEREPDTDADDLGLVSAIFARTALNLKSALSFAVTTETSVLKLAGQIAGTTQTSPPTPSRSLATLGTRITPPRRLTLFNGSPRGRRGNTPILLGQLAEGFSQAGGSADELWHLNRRHDAGRFMQAFATAECVWLGFPLYTDAMPGLVKTFIEELAPLCGRSHNPPLGFLVQSGFPESAHSRHVERYLEKLAARLGSPYLGTIVKGGGEGVRLMPAQANRKLFEQLQSLGSDLAQEGQLSARTLRAIAAPERYPGWLAPVFKLFTRTPWASFYWDDQLKRNGVFQQRNAMPYND